MLWLISKGPKVFKEWIFINKFYNEREIVSWYLKDLLNKIKKFLNQKIFHSKFFQMLKKQPVQCP